MPHFINITKELQTKVQTILPQTLQNITKTINHQQLTIYLQQFSFHQSINSIQQKPHHMDEQYDYQQPDSYNYDQYDEYNGDYDNANQYQNQYIIEQAQLYQYSNTTKQYQVLPYNALFNEVGKHLKKAKEMTTLSEGWCLLLLREFKWDVEKLSDYFQDIKKYRNKIGFNENYTDPNVLNQVMGTCQVCCSQNITLYCNICSHGFCKQCWKNSLEVSIKSGNPFMKCMDCSCPVLNQTILLYLHKFYPLQRRLIETYEKHISQQFSTIHRNYQFCTGADCGNCIKVYNLNLRSVKCTCGKVFCFKCNSDDHSPCTCDQKKLWMENVLKQEADAKWMAVNAKLCPWCKKAVERSAGCNFMACVCGKSFCYLCSRPWQPDHKDHFKCHIFKKSSNDQINRQKQILEKMNFYTERYLDNQATALNNKKIDTFRQRKLLFQTLKIDLSDSQFIDGAYKFSIECCDCLKWIYAYSYYAKWKNPIQEESFKFDQGEFERFKANLLKMLAVDLKRFIAEVEKYKQENKINLAREQNFLQDFKQLKKTIINYFTMTKKYKEKFIQQIENHTEEGIIKKKSSTGISLQRKKTDDKKQKKQVKNVKQSLNSPPVKMTTRSSIQKQKQKQPVPQDKGKLAGWFGKHFS